MEELNFDFPEGTLTPEESARLNKLKSDVAAFYEKHGDHLEWLEQAADLELMEVDELTPDDRQFIEATMKVTEEHDLDSIEGVKEMKEAFERVTQITYLQSEIAWFQQLAIRKRLESGKGLLGDVQTILAAAKAHQAIHPDDTQINEYIQKLEDAIDYFITETTTAELNLAAKHEQSAN